MNILLGFLLIATVVVAGAFAIAGAATTMPISPWLAHVGVGDRAEMTTLIPTLVRASDLRG